MQINKIKGYRMTDKESEMYINIMCEEDKTFQRTVDALNKIGCTSFMLSEEDIKRIKNEKYQ